MSVCVCCAYVLQCVERCVCCHCCGYVSCGCTACVLCLYYDCMAVLASVYSVHIDRHIISMHSHLRIIYDWP